MNDFLIQTQIIDTSEYEYEDDHEYCQEEDHLESPSQYTARRAADDHRAGDTSTTSLN